jgi:hypothetical protein
MPRTVKVKVEKVCSECGNPFTGRRHSRTCCTVCGFWALVDKSGGPDACWPWTSHISKNCGYGDVPAKLSPTGTRSMAHRIAWRLHNLCDPDQLYVLHRCDNPICANPNHLRIGTQRANVLDAWNKGKPVAAAPGKDNFRAKLNDDAVQEIRSGGIVAELAARYGVTGSTIRAVQRRETWRHVE